MINTIYIPYFKNIELKDDRVIYYAAASIPELAGGRPKERYLGFNKNNFNVDDIINLSNKFKNKFQLTANDTHPEYNDRVKNILKILQQNNSSIKVARLEFAEKIKKDFPNLKIHSSCIMNFYTPFEEIMKSELFEKVNAPQFWNFNFDEMFKKVPENQRHRVHFIINTKCKWCDNCKFHYEHSSNTYHNIYNSEDKYLQTCNTMKFEREGKDWDYSLKERFNILQNNGFTEIKLEGRQLDLDDFKKQTKDILQWE